MQMFEKKFNDFINIDLEEYFFNNHLDKLLQVDKYTRPVNQQPSDTFLQEGSNTIFEIDCQDLSRLHAVITYFNVINVIELGSGLSTNVIGDALRINSEKLQKKIAKVRRRDPFISYSVECDAKYIELTRDLISKKNMKHVKIHHTNAIVSKYRDSLAGMHKSLPQVCPDFIYIDGPSPYSYENSGDFNLNVSHPDITNITCDLLTIENFLLPGTIVIFDGMTNNSRFNSRNLERSWLIHEDIVNDYTILILDEEPLGIHNINQLRLTYDI